MMRSVTAGLGALTILAVAGAVTTAGQTFLGFKPSPQAQSAVTVIKDAPPDPPVVPVAHAVAPTAPTAPVAAAPASHHAVPAVAARPVAPAVSRPAVVQRPAVRPAAAPAPAASAAPIPGGLGTALGQAASVANILLNLPQVLTHPGQGVPAPGYAQPAPKKHHEEQDQ